MVPSLRSCRFQRDGPVMFVFCSRMKFASFEANLGGARSCSLESPFLSPILT